MITSQNVFEVFSHPEPWSDDDLARIHHLREAHRKLDAEIRKIVVGMDQVVQLTLIGLFGQGHCLLMGVPGLGKTLLVRTLAASLSLNFRRIQFTPDLMPSDITGTEVIQEDKATGERTFRFLEGPLFTNILLADEINRTPPKTQAALLEAMQERQVTVGGVRARLDAAVLRPGDAEPDRAGRDLSAARGPTGPLHVPDQRRLSDRGRGETDPGHDHLRLRARPAARCSARGDPRPATDLSAR